MASLTVLLLAIVIPSLDIIFNAAFWILRSKAIRQTLCLEELKRLGNPRSSLIKGTAVVCGGSLGGLLTARVCHDHFERVVIIEPEAWLATEQGTLLDASKQTEKRSRVVQYHTAHETQSFGLQFLRELFSNFDQECNASNISGDARIHHANTNIYAAGCKTKLPYEEYDNGDLPRAIVSSRQALETLLRRLVLDKEKYPNIQQQAGTVTGVLSDASNPSKISKVVVRGSEGEFQVEATLVVDCTGATQAGYRWLKQAGYGLADCYPPGNLSMDALKATYDPKIHYSTLQFVITPELTKRIPIPGGYGEDTGTILTVFAKDPKHCFALNRDGNIVLLTTGHWGEGPMPGTLDEVIEFNRTMALIVPLPDWYYDFLEMLKEAPEFLPWDKVRVPMSSCVQYHKAVNLPANFVALGDADSRINPVTAHGISKVMMGVCVLSGTLCGLLSSDSIPSKFSSSFFKVHFEKIRPIWESIKYADYGRPTTIPQEGETLKEGKWMRWYSGKVTVLRLMDNQAASIAFHVHNFLSPRIDFFHPKMINKVFWMVLKQSLM